MRIFPGFSAPEIETEPRRRFLEQEGVLLPVTCVAAHEAHDGRSLTRGRCREVL